MTAASVALRRVRVRRRRKRPNDRLVYCYAWCASCLLGGFRAITFLLTSGSLWLAPFFALGCLAQFGMFLLYWKQAKVTEALLRRGVPVVPVDRFEWGLLAVVVSLFSLSLLA